MKNLIPYCDEHCFSEQISAADLPIFTYGTKESKDELPMLSLFSGCGGMDLGFEGEFICHKK